MSSENGTLKVGARLRRARLSKGLRMRDLAQAVGCDESMISKIEAGKVLPSLPMLSKMVHALDRDMASFFGLKIDEYKLVQKPEDIRPALERAFASGLPACVNVLIDPDKPYSRSTNVAV